GKRECQKPRLAAKMKVGQFSWLWQLFTYTGHNRGTPGTLTTAHPTGFEPVTDAFGEIAHSPLMHWERHSLFVWYSTIGAAKRLASLPVTLPLGANPV